MFTSVSAGTCEMGQSGDEADGERERGLGDPLMSPTRTPLNWPLSFCIHIQQRSHCGFLDQAVAGELTEVAKVLRGNTEETR